MKARSPQRAHSAVVDGKNHRPPRKQQHGRLSRPSGCESRPDQAGGRDALKVKVERVNVMNVRGKIKRLGRFSGKRSDWKKAFVKLKQGEKLELYESA